MIIYRIYIISLFISDMLELIEDKEDIDYAEENIIRQVCSWLLITTELVVEIKPENNSGPYQVFCTINLRKKRVCIFVSLMLKNVIPISPSG